MSYDGLASRLTSAGCPIQASAIYKIEKGDPPRRITVDELVAFAQVFGVSIEHLLLPPEAVATEELADLAVAWNTAQMQAWEASQLAWEAQEQANEAWGRLTLFVQSHEDLRAKVEAFMHFWVQHFWPEDQRPPQFVHRMRELTGDDEYINELVGGEPWAREDLRGDTD
jgi:transcriptional regulator with XRE-family HTH domain